MANKYLLCLLVICITLNGNSVNGKFGRSSHSSSRGSSSSRWGGGSSGKSSSSWGWGSSKPSSSSHNYPSSHGLSGSGSSGHSYSSSSGLSGGSSRSSYPWSGGLSGSSSGSRYPTSNGLSGSGGGSIHSPFPSLSGSNSGRITPWSTGISSSGSGSKYPPSNGLSGSGGSSKYPPSPNLSGSNSGRITPWSTGISSSGSGSKYPPSNGLSGSGGSNKLSSGPSDTRNSHNYYPPSSSGTSNYNTHYTNTNNKPEFYHPTSSHNSHSGYRPTYNGGSYGSSVHLPTYYTSPQHVYVTQYRDSGSRYNDLLTGLTLYNLGRSHTHYNHHYYNDDYYRRRYDTGSSSDYRPTVQTTDEARCLLRVKESGKVEELKIPCEIVSTFTEGSKKEAQDLIRVENTVCQNFTILNNTTTTTSSPISNTTTVSIPITVASPLSVIPVNLGTNKVNTTELTKSSGAFNNSTTDSPYLLNTTFSTENSLKANSKFNNITVSSNTIEPYNITSLQNRTSIILGQNKTAPSTNVTQNISNITIASRESSTFTSPVNTTSTIKPLNVSSTTPPTIKREIVNCTTTITTQLKDPLTIKGPPLNPNNMECEVEIVTKDHRLRSKVDCLTLMEYSKMPEPKKNTGILPSRDKLKSWLSKPPWWMFLFTAV